MHNVSRCSQKNRYSKKQLRFVGCDLIETSLIHAEGTWRAPTLSAGGRYNVLLDTSVPSKHALGEFSFGANNGQYSVQELTS